MLVTDNVKTWKKRLHWNIVQDRVMKKKKTLLLHRTVRLQSNRFKGDAKRFEQIWQSSPDKSKKPNSRIYTLMSLMSFTDGWAAFLLWAPSSVSFMFPVRVNQSCVADRLFLQDYICELRVKLQGVWGVGCGGVDDSTGLNISKAAPSSSAAFLQCYWKQMPPAPY